MRGHCKRQANLHPAAEVFQGSIEKAFHFREVHDLVELPPDFLRAHSQDGAAHEHIFAARELWVETCADLEKAADAAVNLRPADRGADDAGKDFEEGGLAGAVAADETKDFALANVEGDVFQGPESFVLGAAERGARR